MTEPIDNPTPAAAEPAHNAVPPTRRQREMLRQVAEAYVRERSLCPPMQLPELLSHARTVCRQHGQEPYEAFVTVLLSNAVWADTLASIPCEKRLFLIPQCLRNALSCPAKMDEYGLACQQCGRCVIGQLVARAKALGYVTLVAEGSALVMSLIESGQVQGVVGVSCLDTLRRVFPYMHAAAVPGVAIPLLYDGCDQTAVDEDWVIAALERKSDQPATRVPLEQWQGQIQQWFSWETLQEILNQWGVSLATETEKLAWQWLAEGGKRWRPFLLVATYLTLTGEAIENLPPAIKQLAVAVECFHKASLIHDDIEDDDEQRDGRPTLHMRHGVAVALNLGDFLLGEGYQMIAAAELPAGPKTNLLQIAAEGHRALSVGQGEELLWTQRDDQPTREQLLWLARHKTAPAFAVALRMGAVAAVGNDRWCETLRRFADGIGVAYQLRDDLADVLQPAGDWAAGRPNLVIALAGELVPESLQAAWAKRHEFDSLEQSQQQTLHALLRSEAVLKHTDELLQQYKQAAMTALEAFDSAELKTLLQRVIGKIFYDVKVMGCCDDRAGR